LQERFGCCKAQPAVGAGEFLHKLEIPKFHYKAALVDVEETVGFRLADRLLKGDAGQHFECRRREIKTFAPSALLWTSVARSEPPRLRIRS
jgi:hypothetical protein